MDYRGRSVVVTGGTGGLGVAVVEALLTAGAVCYVPYIAEAEARAFRHRDHTQLTLHPHLDVTDEAAVGQLYASIPNLWASIHLVGGFASGEIRTAAKGAFQHQIDVNLTSCYVCCRAAAIAMASRGGRIVNVSARPGLEWRSGAGMAAYAVSKAGVAALTVALGEELVRYGILVNAVAPATLDTPANRQAMPQADFASWTKVEEVAKTILFLASSKNAVTRSAVVPVYGRA